MIHIKNYKKAKALMDAYFAKQLERADRDAKLAVSVYGNPKYWDGKDNVYRFPKNPTWDEGCVCTENSVKRALEVHDKIIPGQIAHWKDRLSMADSAYRLLEINISVTWHRNRLYGLNPKAEAWVCFEHPEYGTRSAYGTGSASGCGYDKRSAAIDEALCFDVKKRDDTATKAARALARASLDRFVIEHGEDLWKEYAIGMTPFPHLCFGGKGSSCLTRLFRRIGCRHYGDVPVKDFLIDYRETDSGSDVYHIIRKDRI